MDKDALIDSLYRALYYKDALLQTKDQQLAAAAITEQNLRLLVDSQSEALRSKDQQIER